MLLLPLLLSLFLFSLFRLIRIHLCQVAFPNCPELDISHWCPCTIKDEASPSKVSDFRGDLRGLLDVSKGLGLVWGLGALRFQLHFFRLSCLTTHKAAHCSADMFQASTYSLKRDSVCQPQLKPEVLKPSCIWAFGASGVRSARTENVIPKPYPQSLAYNLENDAANPGLEGQEKHVRTPWTHNSLPKVLEAMPIVWPLHFFLPLLRTIR